MSDHKRHGRSGSVWTNLTKAPLPPRSITSISVNGSDPNNVFVAYSGFSGFADQNGHVFESTDGGNTWTDVSCHVASCGTPGVNDLANIPVNLVAFADKINTIIVGTDIGVFDSSDGGATWSPLGTGLPRVVVLGADAGRRSGIVHAATHGRSVWALQLPGFAPGPGPFLSSMKLAFAAAGAGATLITLDGANFLSGTSVVEWDGATNGILTTFVSGICGSRTRAGVVFDFSHERECEYAGEYHGLRIRVCSRRFTGIQRPFGFSEFAEPDEPDGYGTGRAGEF